VGAIRNEQEWVYDALGTLKKIILSLEVEISAAATEVENISDLKVTTEQSLKTTGPLLQ
jgi:hypothetical protein